MSPAAVNATQVLVLLAASIGLLIGGIALARKGTSAWQTAGWWTAIVASLFVVAFGFITVIGLSLGHNPFA